MHATTLKEAVARYLLYRDLAKGTTIYYRRICSTFAGWAGGDVLLVEFNGEAISRFLQEKQQAGKSTHYVRSLRNGLMALLRDVRGSEPVERVRTIKTKPLDPQCWSPADVERLLAACAEMPPASEWRWRLMIALAYYTGLDRCDLERITLAEFDARGTLYTHRSKTGAPVVVCVAPDVMAMIQERCPREGPILRMGITPEWFRQIFRGIVERAGLSGTFKKFRKTSGSLVEQIRPGTGHKHLGNSRGIFERHYEARKITRSEPTMPPAIRLQPPDPPHAA